MTDEEKRAFVRAKFEEKGITFSSQEACDEFARNTYAIILFLESKGITVDIEDKDWPLSMIRQATIAMGIYIPETENN